LHFLSGVFGSADREVVMRKALLTLWLVLPIAAWAYHAGPGQDRQVLEKADVLLAEARALAKQEEWRTSAERYERALQALPAGHRAEARRIRLELDKARMLARQLPEAHADLKSLVEEMAADPTGDTGLLAEARGALASSQYYMTWLMRLEGLSAEEWEPEIEAARQNWRLLAEDSERAGDAKATRQHREDLESAVRLARMELKDLQGLPLPSQ
jgi:hypothetical protein